MSTYAAAAARLNQSTPSAMDSYVNDDKEMA
jgi:hypothetical protein